MSTQASMNSGTNSHQAPTVPRVLTVAGSDSGGGAGIQADMKACAAMGVFCTTVVTALTAQNTQGVQGVEAVSASFVELQLLSVLEDIGTDAIKTGMLPNSEIIQTVASLVRRFSPRALVVDPVLVATSGARLADVAVLPTLRSELFPLADVVTPNLPEAAAILGWDVDMIRNREDMKQAAKLIHAMGPKTVLIKGGHLAESEDAVDILYDGQQWHELEFPRILTKNTHGTGCTLASAIAAQLAKGNSILPAVQAAKKYLQESLIASAPLSIGQGLHGPLNHLPSVAKWAPQKIFKKSHLELYAVTDPRMNAMWQRSMEDAVRAAIDGGATIVQIREKDSDTGDFIKAAEAAVKIARESGVPLVINDRVDVALAVGADGVHLGQSDMPASMARALLGPEKIIGVSAKNPDHVRAAWVQGADYVGSGGVYPTNTKENNTTIGLEGLRRVCLGSPLPVVAIGGISRARVDEVLGFGCGEQLGGVAVVSAIFDQPNVEEATRLIKKVVEEARSREALKIEAL